MVPARVSAGALYRVDALRVTDTFGVVTDVKPVANDAGAPWRLHGLTRDNASVDGAWLFIPPPLSDTLEGSLLEQVAFARDEMANLAWGIEKRVQGTSGEPLDRSLEDQRYSIRQQPSVASTDARLQYRLMTPVPSHWLPLVPVREQGNLSLAIQLERGGMKRFYRIDERVPQSEFDAFLKRLEASDFVEELVSSDPDIVIFAFHPRGVVLRADLTKPVAEDGLRIEEEEVSRAGIVVERRFQYARTADGRALLWVGRRKRIGPQYARTADGRALLWVGRRKRIGRGDASSGLAFDLGVLARPA